MNYPQDTSHMPGSKLGKPATGHLSGSGYFWVLLACGVTTAIASALTQYLDLANIVMLFLLTVFLVATRFGRGPAVLAAFVSVALFDFFFVPPQLSFTVSDAQYLVTFAVMLAVALVTAHLTAGLRLQAETASRNERQTQALYEMARQLAGALSSKQVYDIVQDFLQKEFDLLTVLLLPDDQAVLQPVVPIVQGVRVEQQFALMAFEQAQPVEDYTLSGLGYGAGYFPLQAPMQVRGVIMFVPQQHNPHAVRVHKALLATLASLVAIAVERLHYVEVAQASQVQVVSERLRSSILSALSHDLRTPLTAMVGLADSLALSRPPLSPDAMEMAQAIREQSLRLSGLVGNLLDMARLHAGNVALRKEWQPLEEVIGASIQLLGQSLAGYQVRVALDKETPLLEFDAVLLERVFCNLLENAAKYAPAGSVISIASQVQPGHVAVSVCDQGPGFPPEKLDTLFEMFARGVQESATPGVGLGLAICRAIIEAHGGSIHAANQAQGACVSFTLPLGTPPRIDMESDQLEEGRP